ncbi:HlyD family secretion protein [Pantoea sp. Tr-811]|uniref:HlyD family secretion protein n=1 Tax=Pantoea sp. Tr-811 TaxID=2608361 RepID=UPI001421F9CB|nr:HlyD family secretion protein [Pantoea sp. Tr-811]NIF26380.1 HlyD family secretion protein [Pantoea sp. Tr-811]
MNVAVDEPVLANDGRQDDAVSRKQARRRLALYGGAGVVLVGVLVFGGYWYSVGRYLQSTDDAYVRADWVTSSSRVAGFVAKVEVDDDQPVKAGDVLVRLQDRDYRARYEQAKADVAEAHAAFTAAQALAQVAGERIAQQQQAIVQAESMLQSTDAERRRTTLDVKRYKGLVRDSAATLQRLEQANASAVQAGAAWQGAQAQLRERRSQLAMAKAQAAYADAQVEQRQAGQASAQARLVLAEQDVQDTLIRAPIDGVVGQRRVRAGQHVVAGQPLLAVVPLQQTYIVANYKETQLTHMHPGQPVRINVDSYSDRQLLGRVASVSPASGNVFALLPSDNATGNFTKIVQRFPVRILLEQPMSGQPILPGMSVVTTVDTRPTESADE